MYPTVKEALSELEKGYEINPTRWVDHARYTGEAARNIAEAAGLDGEKAYVLGLLHDIGRRWGFSGIRHIVDGYNYAMEKGWDDVARISMTHSFAENIPNINPSMMDMTREELEFTKSYLANIEFDDYDRLMHMCDNIALHSGYVLMEKRMIDISMRHGVHEGTVKRWQELFEIKDYFEKKMGRSIYSVLPGVVENTFDL
ncbi:MAG: HDOD domain-containing protein [Clostridia bacterium]|nr:HDOD domain-containing protein [Clostridia bacterium]